MPDEQARRRELHRTSPASVRREQAIVDSGGDPGTTARI
jgi:hypothetical protein